MHSFPIEMTRTHARLWYASGDVCPSSMSFLILSRFCRSVWTSLSFELDCTRVPFACLVCVKCVVNACKICVYYMVSSVSGQDESNPAF